MGKNAYVNINIRSNGTFLALHPATEGGMGINIEAVEAYLDKVFGGEYEKVLVREELKKPLPFAREILITQKPTAVVDETVVVTIAPDRMTASGRFYPPSEGGNKLDKEGIISEMVKAGVKYGVVDLNLNEFLEKRTYGESILLAEATKQVEGSDAEITYNFNTGLTQKPKVNEDGSVDFHHLDLISSVTAGDLLATLKPAVQGKPGIDVCGGLLRPVKVKNLVLRTGKNIRLSEDGLSAYTEVSGHATVVEDRIFVSDVYEVPANVDASTGDITCEGNVHVRGNVMTGYAVYAKGDIIVDGVVEGATLHAGGHIILKRGVQGMDRAVLKAGGNLISRFIENATAEADGYVTADAIMHSTTVAKGDITVSGKKGLIVGGTLRSGTMISAKNIGSTMGTNTVLEVGIEPEILEEFHKLNEEIEVNKMEQEKNMPQLLAFAKRMKLGEKLSADKMLQFKALNDSRERLMKREEEIIARTKFLKEQIDGYNSGSIRVQGVIYPGCKLTISGASYYVKQEATYCSFEKEQGDVRLGAYY